MNLVYDLSEIEFSSCYQLQRYQRTLFWDMFTEKMTLCSIKSCFNLQKKKFMKDICGDISTSQIHQFLVHECIAFSYTERWRMQKLIAGREIACTLCKDAAFKE